MKLLIRLSAASLLFGATACDEVLSTDGTDTVETGWCDEATTFPDAGALSGGDYTDAENGLECQTFEGDVILSYIPEPSCAGDKWNYTVETKGWTSGGRLTVFDAAGGSTNQEHWWGEQHDWDQGESHSGGWWDQLNKELPVVDFNSYEANKNSYHACDKNNGSTLTWAYEVFDYADQTKRIDCVIVGSYADQLLVKYPDLAGCEKLSGFTPK